MANDIVRPSALTEERTSPVASEFMVVDNGVTVAKARIDKVVAGGRPLASKPEAEAGENTEKAMTPLTTKQSIAYEVGRTIASKAQGDLADTAVQPNDLATVATTGDYDDLSGKPTLGTAAAQNVEAFATATQGGRADTALQPSDVGSMAYEDSASYAPISRAMPPSGTAGQVLTKATGADYDTQWASIDATTAVSYAPQTLTEPQQEQARANIGLGDAEIRAIAGPRRATALYTSNALLSTTIPLSGVPTSTQGTEVATVSFAASSATAKVRIEFDAIGTHETGDNALCAILLIDDEVNARRLSYANPPGLSYTVTMRLVYEYVPGDTDSHTYRIRVGSSGGSMRLNSSSGGGTVAATLTAEDTGEPP